MYYRLNDRSFQCIRYLQASYRYYCMMVRESFGLREKICMLVRCSVIRQPEGKMDIVNILLVSQIQTGEFNNSAYPVF